MGRERFYVSYELFAPAMDEWILHIVDISQKAAISHKYRDPADYAQNWWDEHLSVLADCGELRNYRADWGYPTDPGGVTSGETER